MIDITVVLDIILIHWIADFVAQTEWQANNKSKRNDALLYHVFTYSYMWLIAGCAAEQVNNSFIPIIPFTTFKFVGITFVSHFITDYATSRVNRRLLAIQKVTGGPFHNFFVSIGFDQVLHYFQLFLTYYLLTKS
jgi:hypothetical protein